MSSKPPSFWQQWGPPLGLCLTLLLLGYNLSVVPPIMPLLVRNLESSLGYVQGALVLFSLVTASFTPTAENLSTRLGRERFFAVGLGLFALGIGVASFSPDMGIFVLGYSLLAGLAAAPLVSTPWALMDRIYNDKAEQLAFLALTIAGVIGSLMGSVLGGFLATNLGWRWSFFPELVLIPLILLMVRHVPPAPPQHTQPLDWVGGLLSLLGFGLTLMGISLAGEYGWWIPKRQPQLFELILTPFGISIVPPLIAAGVICLGLFVYWQRQQAAAGKASLLRVGVLSRRTFQIGLIVGTLHTLVNTGVIFCLYLFIPVITGLNPLQTALVVLPYTLTQLVVLVGLVRANLRLLPRVLLQVGIALTLVSLGILYKTVSTSLGQLTLLPGLVLMGGGAGLFTSYIAKLTFSAAAAHERPEARGIYRPFQNLGQSLGRALLGTLLVALASARIVDGILAALGQSISPELRRTAVNLLQQAIQTFTDEERQALFARLPATVQPSLHSIKLAAATEAMQMTLLVALGLSLGCLGLSFLLPKKPLNPSSDLG